MTDFDPDNHDLSGLGPEDSDACWQSAPSFDPAEYLDDLRGLDLTDAQKRDLLTTLWEMLRGFVEMGVDLRDIDPCGQIFDGADQAFGDEAKGVDSSHPKEMEKIASATRKEPPA